MMFRRWTLTPMAGNHEVMMRGTFANIRLKNEMLQAPVAPLCFGWPDSAHL